MSKKSKTNVIQNKGPLSQSKVKAYCENTDLTNISNEKGLDNEKQKR